MSSKKTGKGRGSPWTAWNNFQKKGRTNTGSFQRFIVPIDPDWAAQTGIYAPGAGITPALPIPSTHQTTLPSTSAQPEVLLGSISAPVNASSQSSTATKAKPTTMSAAGAAAVIAINTRILSALSAKSSAAGPSSASKASDANTRNPTFTGTSRTTASTSTKPLIPITQPLQNIQSTVVLTGSPATINPQKLCTTCGAGFHANSSYKQCDSCRKKGRERNRASSLKTSGALAVMDTATKSSAELEDPILDAEVENARHSTENPLSVVRVSKKRKSAIAAAEELKKVKKPKKNKVEEDRMVQTEYQTSDCLYKDLRRWSIALRSCIELPTPPTFEQFNFSGSYSIVMDTATEHASKVNSVLDDLKAYIRYGSGVYSRDKQPGHDSRTVKCLCGARYSTAASCTGTIEVIVGDDNTHPFIPGQKIAIRVRHRSPTQMKVMPLTSGTPHLQSS